MPNSTPTIWIPHLALLPKHPAFADIFLQGGSNREVDLPCQLNATNDIEAVNCWLAEFKSTATTYRHYRKEAERLLLWCLYRRQKPLSSLTRQDLDDYQTFLVSPDPASFWCGPKGTKRGTPGWKPFVGPLSPTSIDTAMSILYSLFGYLHQGRYLAFNPLALIRKRRTVTLSQSHQQTRILPDDEWMAIYNTLEALPEDSEYAQFYKWRLMLIVNCYFYLGLRAEELVSHNWRDFRCIRDQWWFFVVGKGNKEGKIPVNHQLLKTIGEYRHFMGDYFETLLPTENERKPIIITYHKRKRMCSRRVNMILKELSLKAAEQFPDRPEKVERLKKFSAHWLRHQSASMQNRVGVKAKHIQENHRHAKMETTQQYIHAEDDERYQDMTKLRISIQENGNEKAADDNNLHNSGDSVATIVTG